MRPALLACLIALSTSSAAAPGSAPNPPRMTLMNVRFIALHMM